jgi:sarcosine oxidase subunit beta
MRNPDVIVIGAGVIGTSVAYYLTERNYKVLLIDKGDAATGTSSHCDAAAMLTDKQPGADAALGFSSIGHFVELSTKLSMDFEFAQSGSLYVCENEFEYSVATDYVNSLRAEGYSVHMADKKELAEREPYLAKDLTGGFWSDVCSQMNPYRLCFALINEAKKNGLETALYSPVLSMKKEGDEYVVSTPSNDYRSKIVVNCAGIWAPHIGHMLGLSIPIFPRKGVILLTEKTFPLCRQKVQEYGYMVTKFHPGTDRHLDPLIEDNNVSFTIEPTNDDNFLVGSSRNFVGYDISVEPEIAQGIAKRALRFFPVLKDINCIRAYAGLRPFVPDHLPIISPVDNLPGYYIAAGHEGDGISMAPITGILISQMINNEKPDLALEPFRFSRFASNSKKHD